VTTTRTTWKSIADQLEDFVRRAGEIPDDDPDFDRNVHLFEAGYLDSLGVVRLIDYLETTYALKFTENELFDPGFTTVRGISDITAAHLGCTG
jgi:acyl carrier protein